MTLEEMSRMGLRPKKTVLHAPKDGVWGHTVFASKVRDKYYVAAIYMRDGVMLYGAPIPIQQTLQNTEET